MFLCLLVIFTSGFKCEVKRWQPCLCAHLMESVIITVSWYVVIYMNRWVNEGVVNGMLLLKSG